MIAWPSGVNQTVYSDTNWEIGDGVISDTMRSGKKKTRLASSTVPTSVSVVMIFTRDEYAIFETWFKTSLRFGALTFQFPKIAGSGNAEYRILPSPSFSQWGADTIKATMKWEEA